MVKKRSSSNGLNQSLFGSPSEKIVKPYIIPTGAHQCFWYQEDQCATRSRECVNADSDHIVCPIKGNHVTSNKSTMG